MTMEHELYSRLGPVRRRQRARVILDASARGLLAGASAAIVIGLARWPAAFGAEDSS